MVADRAVLAYGTKIDGVAGNDRLAPAFAMEPIPCTIRPIRAIQPLCSRANPSFIPCPCHAARDLCAAVCATERRGVRVPAARYAGNGSDDDDRLRRRGDGSRLGGAESLCGTLQVRQARRPAAHAGHSGGDFYQPLCNSGSIGVDDADAAAGRGGRLAHRAVSASLHPALLSSNLI